MHRGGKSAFCSHTFNAMDVKVVQRQQSIFASFFPKNAKAEKEKLGHHVGQVQFESQDFWVIFEVPRAQNVFGSFCCSFFPPPPPNEFRAGARFGIEKEFCEQIKPNSNYVFFKRK